MRIESALYTSKEGLSVHGQALSVIGDNISNANTTGYKTSRIEFADLISAGDTGAQSGAIPDGGNGVAVKAVRQVHETGVIEFTGRALDVAIAGKGQFMVGDSSAPYYTRAGNMFLNENGVLVNSDGFTVLGLPQGSETLGELNINNLSLVGTPTSTSAAVGNLDAASEITTAPTNPATFTEIGASASHIANLGVYDSQGARHEITLAYFKTDTNTWTAQAYIDGGEVGGTEGVPAQVGANATLAFDETGTLTSTATTINATPAYSNGAAAGNFAIDFAGYTQFASPSQLSSITQNGRGAGNIKDFEIRTNGEFYANLDTGINLLVGTIQLADFPNVDGLERVGNNLFIAGTGTGDPDIGTAGSGGFGEVEGGSLERSTVDIANQFIDLVLYQRGYQANSQVFNTTNGMIRDTLQLIR